MKQIIVALSFFLSFAILSNAQDNCILPEVSFEEFQQIKKDISKEDLIVQKVFMEEKNYYGVDGKWRFCFYSGIIGLSSVVFESEQQYILPHEEELEKKEHQKYISATSKIYKEYCYKYGRPIIIKDRLNTYEPLLFNAEWHYKGHRISLSLHRVGFEKEKNDNTNQLNAVSWLEEKPYYSLYICFNKLDSLALESLPLDKFYIGMPYLNFMDKFPSLCKNDSLINGSFIKKESINNIEIQWIYQFKESQLISTTIKTPVFSDEGRILSEDMVNKYIATAKRLSEVFSEKIGEPKKYSVAEWDNKMIPFTEKVLLFSSWETQKHIAQIELKGDNYGKEPIQKLSLSAKIEIKDN